MGLAARRWRALVEGLGLSTAGFLKNAEEQVVAVLALRWSAAWSSSIFF